MKRGAENQITKDNADDDEIEEVDPSQGFKKANESVLAARPMKGLPKRGNASNASFEAPGAEKKMNFGSGNQPLGSTSSSGFTFNAPPAASTLPVSQSSSDNPPFKFSGSPVSSNASSASKQLSSLLGSTPQMNGTHASVSGGKSLNGAKHTAEAKFFTSLRGLNETLRVEIVKLMSSDPFVDLGAALETYKSFRATIQKEFDAGQKPQGAPLTNGNSSSLFGSKSNSSAPKSVATPSLPAPPTSFAGFGAPSSTSTPSSSNSSAIGGFKPNLSATSGSSSPFKFGTPFTAEEKSVSSSSPFGMASSSAAPKASVFGNDVQGSKQTTPFGGISSGSSPFGTASSSAAVKPPTSFGTGSAFGSIPDKSDASKSSTMTPPNIFGGSGLASSTTVPTFGAPTSSSSSFSFGGTKSSSGSLGNPVGFSFSNSSPTPDLESSKAKDTGAAGGLFAPALKAPISVPSYSSAPSGFSFGTSSSAGASGSQETAGPFAKSSTPISTSSAPDSRSGTPASADGGDAPAEDSSTPKVLGENPNDLEGEGEEDETSVCTNKAKIYRLAKSDEQMRWAEIGVGMLRVKKHKETGASRLLSRNSANGKIMMNFKLFSGFKINRTKQFLNFVGHENGANMTYRVKLKTEADAIELNEAIDKEVSSL